MVVHIGDDFLMHFLDFIVVLFLKRCLFLYFLAYLCLEFDDDISEVGILEDLEPVLISEQVDLFGQIIIILLQVNSLFSHL